MMKKVGLKYRIENDYSLVTLWLIDMDPVNEINSLVKNLALHLVCSKTSLQHGTFHGL